MKKLVVLILFHIQLLEVNGQNLLKEGETLNIVSENGISGINIKYDSNAFLITNENNIDIMYIEKNNVKNIDIINGAGENELNYKHASILFKENILFYDQSISKLLLLSDLKTSKISMHEFVVNSIYDRIIKNNSSVDSNVIDFTLFSMTASKIGKYKINLVSYEITMLNELKHSFKYYELRKDNVLFTINEVHVLDDESYLLVNQYYPFYMLYNPTKNIIDKIAYYDDFNIKNTKLKKDGSAIVIPNPLLKESVLLNKKLYIKFYNKNDYKYEKNTILLIDLISKKNKKIELNEKNDFQLIIYNEQIAIINNRGWVKIVE